MWSRRASSWAWTECGALQGLVQIQKGRRKCVVREGPSSWGAADGSATMQSARARPGKERQSLGSAIECSEQRPSVQFGILTDAGW